MSKNQKNIEKPEISFEHVLIELSKNRKDPCEIIRELIANSYDANASRIDIYPLLQYEGFIFFDDGEGISETDETSGITPYKAFFSIGKSTKIFGESIGYKCQGSKLCFASNKFTLITRCQEESYWRSVSIDNPKDNLANFNLNARIEDNTPWNTLKDLFSKPDMHTNAILKSLCQRFFEKDFAKKGTLIIVQGIEIENFAYYYGTDGHNHENINNDKKKMEAYELSYLRNYIRFNTKHGDVRNLQPRKTGFSPTQANNFKKSPNYKDNCQLHLWTKGELKKVEFGYPYLPKPDPQDIPPGMQLTSQRGVFICSQGIKVCAHNELFDYNGLKKKYSVLATTKGQQHYTFMIDGNFELVTDRNSLNESALKTLKSDAFIKKVEDFLAEHSQKTIFDELINRLNGEKEEMDRDSYIESLDTIKHNIKYRTRFKVEGIEQLRDLWLFVPNNGEENWVVHCVYVIFSLSTS